jgi:excisionase family DNA binding protein
VNEPFLTTRELADLLRFKPATIQDWYEAGKIRGHKYGGRLRFHLSEVTADLEKKAGAGGEVAPVPFQAPAQGRGLTVAPVPFTGGEDHA